MAGYEFFPFFHNHKQGLFQRLAPHETHFEFDEVRCGKFVQTYQY